MKLSPNLYGYTRVGCWLKRHGWLLESVEPHGYAITHYWRSPHGTGLHTQTYALIEQRRINKTKAEGRKP